MGKSLAKLVPQVIRKIDAAREALAELAEHADQEQLHAMDSRVKLQSDLTEYAEYLERATWWKK